MTVAGPADEPDEIDTWNAESGEITGDEAAEARKRADEQAAAQDAATVRYYEVEKAKKIEAKKKITLSAFGRAPAPFGERKVGRRDVPVPLTEREDEIVRWAARQPLKTTMQEVADHFGVSHDKITELFRKRDANNLYMQESIAESGRLGQKVDRLVLETVLDDKKRVSKKLPWRVAADVADRAQTRAGLDAPKITIEATAEDLDWEAR